MRDGATQFSPMPSLALLTTIITTVTSTIIEAQAPCQYDLPYTDTFPIYCQLNYHGAKYLCDPSGMMSRTEVDLLESSVSSLNLSSAFCQPHCGGKQLRVAVVLEDVASLHGLQSCSQSVSPLLIGSPRPPSLIAASLEFARLVNEHWDEAAPADLLIVLIKTWHPSHLHRPIVVPYFTRRLARLSRYSVGMFISPRQTYLEALKETFAHVGKLLAKKEQITIIPKPTTVPRWVIYSTVALLALVIFSVRLANWVSRRMNRARKPKWNTHSYKADSRFRAGFAGGMMIRNEQSRKSTMMFRSFNKRNGIPTAQRI